MIANPIPWPNGARCAVAITWDVDADSGLNYNNPETADNLVATQSFLRYGPQIAVPRLMEVFRQLDMRQTFFVPGWVIARYPETVDLILENHHEVALHGYIHERSNELSWEEETYLLDRALAAFVSRVGAQPRGWRAPGFAFSKNSLACLTEAAFDYDSSLMGDEIPYMLEGATGRLLEFPTDWTFDDWPHYMHNRDFHYTMPISSPKRAMEVFHSEFDAAWEYGALWIPVWHPFVSARPARLHAIIEFVAYMRARGDVWFARLDEVCDHVQKLMNEGVWQPRIEKMPAYVSPIPELARRPA